MEELPVRTADFQAGSVWLVGAGPGDPGLLTLHALNALRRAEVIVYDALVSREVLELANPAAVLEHAGKRGGKPSAKQPDISARLIELARAGKRVLRLKGGDPFVFGRGGEEMLALAEAGVAFRIVPGITAGVAGLAYAAVPATHRSANSIVTFLTGHNAAGVVPGDIDWQAVASGSPVLVLYMALKHLEAIRARLLENGRKPEEAMMLVAKATTPEQRIVETTLGDCLHDVAGAGLVPPAIVVVGEVVKVRRALQALGLDVDRVAPYATAARNAQE